LSSEVILAKRERLTGIQTKQILLKLPSGLYEEIMRIVEKKKLWNSVQEFIRDALIAEIHKQDQEDRDNESEKF
jgi:metal-responsive CopG/Arc/MetJ family transcriptional regulator